ncbi:MAG TPA: ribulose-phosphate 3-epimerase [Dehalococcoidia bacterium]|nr:ribulose-phosphate 3-epimerase [Dehalococcoidia bacterium]
MSGAVRLAPSVLAADFARLGDLVREAEAAGADAIHIDVMDGRFVPVISLGTPIVEAVRRVTGLTLDIHLMIEEPERHVGAFMDAGGDVINVHVEATRHAHRIAREVRGRGKLAGACINPGTPVGVLEALLPELDQLIVMAVNPGWSGQKFIQGALPKVRSLRQMIDGAGLATQIEVDGGVTAENAPACAAAGANVLVAATAVFNDRASVAENIARLRAALAAGAGK